MILRLIPHLVIWAVLATVVVFLALYRRRINAKSDELLHVLDSEAQQLPGQEAVAKKLESVDRWGKILTAIAILYALGIAAYYMISVFQDTSIPL